MQVIKDYQEALTHEGLSGKIQYFIGLNSLRMKENNLRVIICCYSPFYLFEGVGFELAHQEDLNSRITHVPCLSVILSQLQF